MLVLNSISNINRGLKKNSLLVFENYNEQLIKVLNILWKKKLITGYRIKSGGVEIIFKYNKNSSIIKELKIISKPSIKRFKKKKIKIFFF